MIVLHTSRRRTRLLAAVGALEILEFRRLLAGVTVSTTDDVTDGDTSNITNLIANPGPTGINIREAIVAANNTPGADVVNFSIAGAGPHTLQLGGALPGISDTLTINGYTQPGAQANTLPLGNNAVIKIQLSGAGGVAVGLNVLATNCVIQGLSMTAFDRPDVEGSGAILLQAPGAVIEGNWIGIAANGTVSGNHRGIGGTRKATGAQIGGTTPAARNVVSGNTFVGIGVAGGNTLILGNYIGTTIVGNAAVPNGTGVAVVGSDITIGGAGIGARNVIAGNTNIGIDARGEGHAILGNFVGLGANGESLGNGSDGIRLRTPLISEVVIRVGAEKDAFNAPVIAYNGGQGINVAEGRAVIGQVSLHSNFGTGVSLPSSGPSVNLTSAISTTTSTTVNGLLSGLTPGSDYIIRFYGNTPDGEFESQINGFGLTADANGQAQLIDVQLDACGLSAISAILVKVGAPGEEDFTVARSEAVVNTTPPVIEITNALGSGPGSLLAAFTAANLTPGPDVILFNVPGAGFLDITPTSSISGSLPPFRINDVLWEGRGQGFGNTVPRCYLNVNNGLGTFNGGANNTVAGVGFYNVSGRAWDAEGSNNTFTNCTVGIGAAEQPLGVSSIVQSDVVRILGGSNNRILSSVIHAGRNNACVAIYGGTNHLVQDNRVGITPTGVVLTGTAALNNRVGVVINDGTGTDLTNNTIVGMTQDAIKVGEFGFVGGTGHTFSANHMFQNQQLGIDLADNGVTANDPPPDSDAGPNNLQNFPVIISAEQVLTGARITGTFAAAFNTTYLIEAFASPSNPLINTNEGARSLGTFNIITDATGLATFDETFADGALVFEWVLVNATAPDGSTSEFSVGTPVVDNLTPSVFSGAFEFEYDQSISFECSEGAISGVDPSDIVVERLPPGGVVEVVAAFLLNDQDKLRYILSDPAGGTIPDGDYRCTFQTDSIQDAAGNAGPPASFTDGGNPRILDFFIFAGDANRDRTINISDFAILAGNFNEDGFFTDGDFNYSGRLEIGDFAILASKFNTSLPVPSDVPRVLATAGIAQQLTRAISFSQRLIDKLMDDDSAEIV